MSKIGKEFLDNNLEEKTKRIERLINSSINCKETHSKFMTEKS